MLVHKAKMSSMSSHPLCLLLLSLSYLLYPICREFDVTSQCSGGAMYNPMHIQWIPTGICIPGNATSSIMLTCASPNVVKSTYGTAPCSGRVTQTRTNPMKTCAKSDDDGLAGNLGFVGVDTCSAPPPPTLAMAATQVLSTVLKAQKYANAFDSMMKQLHAH